MPRSYRPNCTLGFDHGIAPHPYAGIVTSGASLCVRKSGILSEAGTAVKLIHGLGIPTSWVTADAPLCRCGELVAVWRVFDVKFVARRANCNTAVTRLKLSNQ